jgi:hypothetical protein
LSVVCLILIGAFAAGIARAESDPAMAAFQNAGKEASITLFPTLLAGQASSEVTDVAGLMLERATMDRLEASQAAFRPPADADLERFALAFGEFVRDQSLETDYALVAEYLGSPASGVDAVRVAVVDRAGRVVWADRQGQGDVVFERVQPDCPMTCTLLAVEMVRSVLDLPDPQQMPESEEGKFAQRMIRRSGLPPSSERDAMNPREKHLKATRSNASLVVYPVRRGDGTSVADGERLAELLRGQGFRVVTSTDLSPGVEVEPSRDQLSMLWGLAGSFRDHLREHPADADYALVADYIGSPQLDRVGAVNYVICDRSGEWVLVGLQNSHHDEFNEIAPDSPEDCGRLVAKSLASRFE